MAVAPRSGLNYQLVRALDPFHLLLLAGTAAVVVGALAMAVAGVPMSWCLLVLALAPWVSVVGYEVAGYRHNARALAEL